MHYVAAELYTNQDRLLFPSKAAFEKYAAKILDSSGEFYEGRAFKNQTRAKTRAKHPFSMNC
jgi:hypothetical protein